jgi:hypothetical protein
MTLKRRISDLSPTFAAGLPLGVTYGRAVQFTPVDKPRPAKAARHHATPVTPSAGSGGGYGATDGGYCRPDRPLLCSSRRRTRH